MFIFPREMFFEYCRFIFGILEKFRFVAGSEKRFFISERLTGMFMYKQFKDGAVYKNLPINFIAEPTDIPVIYSVNAVNIQGVINSMCSLIETADKTISFSFYLLYDPRSTSADVPQKAELLKKSHNCFSIEYIGICENEEYYPLIISDMLSEKDKCLYFTENVTAEHDITEFYRTCNLYDYMILGLPENRDVQRSEDKELRGEVFAISCKKFRENDICKKAEKLFGRNSAVEILNELCRNNIGYFAQLYVEENDKTLYIKGGV